MEILLEQIVHQPCFFLFKDKCFIPDSRVAEKSAVWGGCGIAQGCKVMDVMILQAFYIRNL